MERMLGWERVWGAYVDAVDAYRCAKGRSMRKGAKLRMFGTWARLLKWCMAHGEATPKGCSPYEVAS